MKVHCKVSDLYGCGSEVCGVAALTGGVDAILWGCHGYIIIIMFLVVLLFVDLTVVCQHSIENGDP